MPCVRRMKNKKRVLIALLSICIGLAVMGGVAVLCLNAFVKSALAKKVAVVPGSTFNCDTTAPSLSFRLNYSTPTDEQIVTGVARLGEAVREFLK